MGIPNGSGDCGSIVASPGAPGMMAFLKQAGCMCEELRMADHGFMATAT